ncbi:MAG TPA: hypothetical protein VL362_02165 [Patescibacteria group bacterium]|jgi:hypothetical protein|nr:hypothetical protein [Patescibacteria group bacterium]
MHLTLAVLETRQLNDNAWQLLISVVMLAAGALLVGFRKELPLKILGLLAALGGLVWLAGALGLSSGVTMTAAAVLLLVISFGQVGQTKGGSRLLFVITAVIAVLALIVLVPGITKIPSGTVVDVLVAGWNALVDLTNVAADQVSRA